MKRGDERLEATVLASSLARLRVRRGEGDFMG